MKAIAHLSSPFKEKFGLPRQPGLIQYADAFLMIEMPYATPDAFKGIEGYSHLWLQFLFHEVEEENDFRPMVRPPRLGGNEKIGVFACRSPYRPNRLGLSLVEFKGLEHLNGRLAIRIACPDLVDGTPILDIKPYIPYADSASNPRCDLASEAPSKTLSVVFSDAADKIMRSLSQRSPIYSTLKALITETIGYDPRPAYKQTSDDKEYGLRLYDLDVKWLVRNGKANVTDIVEIGS